jgi:hypothetical protein
MAGNLKEYRFTNRKGFSTPGKDAAWVGSNVGYAAEPRETVNYVSGEFTFTFIRMGNSID